MQIAEKEIEADKVRHIRRTTTIEQHGGTHHATGLPEMRLFEVVTEVDLDSPADNETIEVIDRIHDAEVKIAQRDVELREATKLWMADHYDTANDLWDDALLLERALVAVQK